MVSFAGNDLSKTKRYVFRNENTHDNRQTPIIPFSRREPLSVIKFFDEVLGIHRMVFAMCAVVPVENGPLHDLSLLLLPHLLFFSRTEPLSVIKFFDEVLGIGIPRESKF